MFVSLVCVCKTDPACLMPYMHPDTRMCAQVHLDRLHVICIHPCIYTHILMPVGAL
jgi:hypothetical protein